MSTENQPAPLIPENSPSSVVEVEEQTEEKKQDLGLPGAANT